MAEVVKDFFEKSDAVHFLHFRGKSPEEDPE